MFRVKQKLYFPCCGKYIKGIFQPVLLPALVAHMASVKYFHPSLQSVSPLSSQSPSHAAVNYYLSPSAAAFLYLYHLDPKADHYHASSTQSLPISRLSFFRIPH